MIVWFLIVKLALNPHETPVVWPWPYSKLTLMSLFLPRVDHDSMHQYVNRKQHTATNAYYNDITQTNLIFNNWISKLCSFNYTYYMWLYRDFFIVALLVNKLWGNWLIINRWLDNHQKNILKTVI